MSDPMILTLAVAVLGSGGLGAVVAAWITKRPQPGTRENSLIDQLQEVITAQREREGDAQKAARESQRREASLMNYAWECQRHIQEGKPPPPPRWPDDLITR